MKTKIYTEQIVKTTTVHTKETPFKNFLVYKTIIDENGKKQEFQGICKENDKPSKSYPNSRFGNTYELVHNDLLKEVARYGWFGKERYPRDIWKLRSQTPFDDIDKKDYTIIKFDGLNHLIYDVDNGLLPVARRIDYLDGGITNERYNLNIAHEILKKHPYVSDLSEILDVPYYNNDSGNTRYVRFTWTPDTETYRKVMDYCKEKFKQYPYVSYNIAQAMWDLDILGLRKGGAAKFKNFSDTVDDQIRKLKDD